MTCEVVYNHIAFKVQWSKRMTKTNVKLLDKNRIKVSQQNVKSQQELLPILASLFLDAQTFIDETGTMWLKGSKIGSGGFSTVYSCKNNKNVVLKVGSNQAEKCAYEKLVIYDFVPKLYGFGVYNQTECLVLERFKTDLNVCIKKGIDTDYAIYVARMILQCLKQMHNVGYVHCDIKPQNIFLTSDTLPCKAVLGDLGMCKEYSLLEKYSQNTFRRRCGTLAYMSCDVHQHVLPTPRSDLESFGWVLIEMFGGKLPWKLLSEKTYEIVLEKKLMYKENCTLFLKDCFIENSWPTFMQTFFTTIWTLPYNKHVNYNNLLTLFES